MHDHLSIRPASLRCEYLRDPLGIDVKRPRLSWVLQVAEGSGEVADCRVLVASAPNLLAPGKVDKWDSQRMPIGNMTAMIYDGVPLQSRQRCYWTVRLWDEEGQATPFTPPAVFEMGLLNEGDWRAKWVGAPNENWDGPRFRTDFDPSGKIRRGRLYVCGLGYFEAFLNGQKIGNHKLEPNWTDYDEREMRNLGYPFDDQTSKRVLYRTFDVTHQLVGDAKNVIGMWLGNGWYNQTQRLGEGELDYGAPRFIAQLEITYDDGTRDMVVSDESWLCEAGPLVHNSIFRGEVYDARRDTPNWSKATTKVSEGRWSTCESVTSPTGGLNAQMSPSDKVRAEFLPVKIWHPEPGRMVCDFGRNVSGWVRLQLQGKRSEEVELVFAEECDAEGELDFASCGGRDQIQSDRYVLSGQGVENYAPRFTWHTFRYAELCYDSSYVDVQRVDACEVHADVDRTGHFACSDDVINETFELYCRTQLANYHGAVPSDCPHRERLGYTGDGHLTAASALACFDAVRLYRKWQRDMRDAQNPESGFVPHTAPFYGGGGGPAWGAAVIIVPWELYRHTGDVRVLRDNYSAMRDYLRYLSNHTDSEGIITHEEPGSWCLGDWSLPDASAMPDETDLAPELVNTAYYGYCADCLARAAGILGKQEESERFREKLQDIRRNFHRRFYDPEGKCYGAGCHGTEAFALALGAVPKNCKPAVLKHLKSHLQDLDWHLDTGILGTPLLLRMLSENGMLDVACRLASQKTYPGFGHMVEEGATTLWENWSKDKGSHCHPMYGSVVGWFFRYLAGIRQKPATGGYRQIEIQPGIDSGLDWAEANVNTPSGRVSSYWHRMERGIELNVNVPSTSSADICFPVNILNKSTIDENTIQLRESGRIFYPVEHEDNKPKGVETLSFDEGGCRIKIRGGSYEFSLSSE